MEAEKWRFEQPLQVAAAIARTLSSNEQTILHEMLEVLWQRQFLFHHAQGFEQAAVVTAYTREEDQYLKHVKIVARSNVTRDSNVISGHVVCKIKYLENDELKLKARIAPHGNEGSDTKHLKSDCAMCPPLGIRIILSACAIKPWLVVRIDVESAFHQTGPTIRQVFVRLPRESHRSGELWLLLVAGYGLINAGDKWQNMSDDVFIKIGLTPIHVIPQLFAKYCDGVLTLLVIKIVDDVLMTGLDDELRWFADRFSTFFKLGEIESGPSKLRFFGMTLVQDDDYTCNIHFDEKLNDLGAYPLERLRRKQENETLTNVELSAFKYLNSSLSWIRTVASPLCAFYSSHLQQKLPSCTVHDLVSQANALALHKRHGTLTLYPRPKPGSTCAVNMVAFADANHHADRSQLCYVIGLVFGKVAQGSVFHLLAWASHKSRRPVHSTPAAEVLAASEALDEMLLIHEALCVILQVKLYLYELVDSKDLYTSLSTQRASVYKSIRGEVNVIRFYYETKLDVMGWIKGVCNHADVGTKPNSALTDAVVLMQATGQITLDMSSLETRSNNHRLG